MAPQEPIASCDRGTSTVCFNMKTARRLPPTASKPHTNTLSCTSNDVPNTRSPPNDQPKSSAKSSSPTASSRGPLNIGNLHQPKTCAPTVVPKFQLSSPLPQPYAQVQESRTPSPNYFGLHNESVEGRDSDRLALGQDRWTPSTSCTKSFGAAIPKQVPLDANPEFEAFKRQADANRGSSSFSLGSSHFGDATPYSLATGAAAAVSRPRPSRWHTHCSNASTTSCLPRLGTLAAGTLQSKNAGSEKLNAGDASASAHDSDCISVESNRCFEATFNPPFFLNLPANDSPIQLESPFEKRSGFGLSKVDDRHPRLSMVQGKADPPSPLPYKLPKARSETVPLALDPIGSGLLSPTQLKEMIGSRPDTVLLLDLRVSPQYALSRIKGALNLCIPTTLLKRATFNLQKLQQTFQGNAEQGRFARWRDTHNLVVYDAFSTEKRDAVSAMNTIKKFTNEGYTGRCWILRGGFQAFSAAFPTLIEGGNCPDQSSSSRPTLSLAGPAWPAHSTDKPSVAPVVGGVMLPSTSHTSKPFFSNIRQNQDLVDGVGQMAVSIPQGANVEALPRWLREAASLVDKGKKVSEKFLKIELAEQSRMNDAYSYLNPATSATAGAETRNKLQLSGIEKGNKNRYKDILPFDHARVRLGGKAEGVCDYVNASHIKPSRSHKRYIACQGPLPATFEDFWSVVWDQDVRVIVMLTAESEGGQLKCHRYWKDAEFGPIKLRVVSEKKVSLDIDKDDSQSQPAAKFNDSVSSDMQQQDDVFGFGAAAAEVVRRRANTTTTLDSTLQQTRNNSSTNSAVHGEAPYVIIRQFALANSAHPFAPLREIAHLHYSSWPDFGAPAQPSHLLALVDLANVMQRASLPVDVPNAMASENCAGELETSIKNGPGMPSPKKRSRVQSSVPLARWEEPESDQATRPMLVHCSAGCGRTGTFCTVDSVIDMLKRQRIRNIKRANANIEKKVRSHQSERCWRERDPDDDIAIAGLSFGALRSTAFSDRTERGDPFDDAISPGTAVAPKSPISPDISMGSPSPTRSGCSDSEDDDQGIDTTWLDDDTIDLISFTVSDFRCQRLSMVQTLRQFVLCYETIIEWVWRLQERSGPAGSALTASGTSAAGRRAAMRARGRSGTVAHVGYCSK